MKTEIIVTVLMLLSIAANSSAEERGTTHHSSQDEKGATLTTDTAESSAINADGSTVKTTEVKTEIDPKGLANKVSAKSVNRREQAANGDYTETKIVKHGDGTVEEISSEKRTRDHWQDKGKSEHKHDIHSVDPAGFGNKQSFETREDTSIEASGASKTTKTQLLNGKELTREETQQKK